MSIVSEDTQQTTMSSSSSYAQRNDILEIQPDGLNFLPDATRLLNKIITSYWHGGAYMNWHDVPPEVRELWWHQFNLHVKYDEIHKAKIKRIFKRKGSEKIKNVVYIAKRYEKKPWFISNKNWEKMQTIFATTQYEPKCNKSRKTNSEESTGSVNCGGSISIQAHKRQQLEVELKGSDTAMETFERTYQRRKKSGGWSGRRASNTTVIAVGGPKKGRIYEMGMGASSHLVNQESSTVNFLKTIAELEDTIDKLKKKDEEWKEEMKKKNEEWKEEMKRQDIVIAELLKGQEVLRAQINEIMATFQCPNL